jgi:hypothetical protein
MSKTPLARRNMRHRENIGENIGGGEGVMSMLCEVFQ